VSAPRLCAKTGHRRRLPVESSQISLGTGSSLSRRASPCAPQVSSPCTFPPPPAPPPPSSTQPPFSLFSIPALGRLRRGGGGPPRRVCRSRDAGGFIATTVSVSSPPFSSDWAISLWGGGSERCFCARPASTVGMRLPNSFRQCLPVTVSFVEA